MSSCWSDLRDRAHLRSWSAGSTGSSDKRGAAKSCFLRKHPTVPEDLSLTLVIQRVACPCGPTATMQVAAWLRNALKKECCFHAMWFSSTFSWLLWVGCNLTKLLLYRCQFGLAHTECSLTITRVKVVNHYS